GGCLEWLGARCDGGYGMLRWKGKAARVHRLSYESINGKIPAGMFVCHHCDNRGCFNPEHLFLGTANDNNQDMILKSRGRFLGFPSLKGAYHPASRVGELSVQRIKIDVLTQRQIGEAIDTSHSSVGAILRGKSWKHLGKHQALS